MKKWMWIATVIILVTISTTGCGLLNPEIIGTWTYNSGNPDVPSYEVTFTRNTMQLTQTQNGANGSFGADLLRYRQLAGTFETEITGSTGVFDGTDGQTWYWIYEIDDTKSTLLRLSGGYSSLPSDIGNGDINIVGLNPE